MKRIVTSFVKCLLGPRLLRTYPKFGDRIVVNQVMDYQQKSYEGWGDSILSSLSYASSLVLYTAPLVIPMAFTMRRGWFTVEGGIFLTKFLAGVGLVAAVSLVLRTVGRFCNPQYKQFLEVLTRAQGEMTPQNKAALSKYDFQFSSWPAEFRVADVEGDESKPRLYLEQVRHLPTPIDILSWLLTHTFGIKLVYPGSIRMLSGLMERPLADGRMTLMEEKNGQRFKIVTRDNNEIDTMFVEQKNRVNGKTLVICCEGNAGFYEIGIMSTPIEAGYSVLGWNHPGFYGSTGDPYPYQETQAADAVMQFAIHKLGFHPENILVTGWSIGGYSATWLAMNYPDVKGVILDATFDDLVPLAVPRMPGFMSGLVRRAVRSHINLNVAEQLLKYPGPTKLIRRTMDEMITTSSDDLSSNRGNHLLMTLLSYRYPSLSTTGTISSLATWLSSPGLRPPQDEELAAGILHSYIEEHGTGFPCLVGAELGEEQKEQMLIFLASKHMSEVDTTHCTPLPTSHFTPPWEPAIDSQYVNISAQSSGGEEN